LEFVGCEQTIQRLDIVHTRNLESALILQGILHAGLPDIGRKFDPSCLRLNISLIGQNQNRRLLDLP
jgi:hypothetical protein